MSEKLLCGGVAVIVVGLSTSSWTSASSVKVIVFFELFLWVRIVEWCFGIGIFLKMMILVKLWCVI